MDQKSKKVVLCGGGTGGHIFPSIAVGEYLKKNECDLYFIGVNKKLEEKIAEDHNIDFYGYDFAGFPRKLNKDLITWPLRLMKAVNKAKIYLRHFKPDIVFGTGGYSAAPVFIAAKRLKVPYIIHNLDVRLGLANKFCIKNASLITLGFNSNYSDDYAKSIVTGNPIRENFLKIQKEDKLKIYKEFNLDPNKKTLFVVGGSQGANAINETLLDICKELVLENDIQVIHQTGEAKHEVFTKRIPARVFETGKYISKSFFTEPEKCYFISDLVLARAGAMTTTEITVMGKPAIFIPYPFAGNHQEENILHLVNAGGAYLIRQSELISSKLLKLIISIIKDDKKLEEMSSIVKSFSKPNATEKIGELILNQL